MVGSAVSDVEVGAFSGASAPELFGAQPARASDVSTVTAVSLFQPVIRSGERVDTVVFPFALGDIIYVSAWALDNTLTAFVIYNISQKL